MAIAEESVVFVLAFLQVILSYHHVPVQSCPVSCQSRVMSTLPVPLPDDEKELS